MAGGGAWSRRVAVRQRTLRGLVRDTQRAASDVTDILNIDPEISSAVQEIGSQSSRSTALVILGSSAARARLLHCLLGRQLLPDPMPRGCRWLRIQYGSNTAAHLTLGGSEFELVEELKCNQGPWDTIPVEDLIRQDQTDLATMLEIELNNQFLKDGLKIIVPPDIPTEPGNTNYAALKQIHSEFYSKREHILKNFNPVYLFAIDKISRNIFSESIVYDSQIGSSKSEEEFCTMFNLYYMAGLNVERDGESKNENVEERKRLSEQWKESSLEPSVFNSENCLDLHQIKEINPKAQVFFILFSNSSRMKEDTKEERRREERVRLPLEATESGETELFRTEDLPESDQGCFKDVILGNRLETPDKSKDERRLQEEQIAFMNDLLDQWELMSSPPQKHYVKSQWTIVDDVEIMRTAENKALAPYLSNAVQNANETRAKGCKREDERRVVSRSSLLNQVVKFAAECCQSYLLEYATRLSEIHVKLVQQLILSSFSLARELQLVPKKIQYVATHEQHLYETITKKFSEGEKKQELLDIMQEVLIEIRAEIDNMDWSVDDLLCHQDRRFVISNSVFYSSTQSSPEQVSLQVKNNLKSELNRPTGSSTCQIGDSTCQIGESTCQMGESTCQMGESTCQMGESTCRMGESTCQIDESTCQTGDQTPSDGEEAVSYESFNFDDYDIISSNDESICAEGGKNKSRPEGSLTSAVNAIRVENETEMFSMSSSLFRTSRLTDTVSTTCTNSVNISVKQASLDVQQNVLSQLSRKISLKLVKFVDCLKDTYFGTLQRCLESLEECCMSELSGRPASSAMRALWTAARAVDLQPCASFSVLRELVDSLRRLFHKLRIVSSGDEEACCVLSPVWRRRVAQHTARSLTPQRLAHLISNQILERVSLCHLRYQSALATLQAALGPRLHHTEDTKRAIRKKYAPLFARLCLESTSMCDLLMYGTPELGREIGRGQYGVVYSVRGEWGGGGGAGRGAGGGAAVKSVLPADERHYHELAMEFFYTRSIPPHPRIVRLLGSIVQRQSGGGAPCVLLVSERRTRDLHAAVRAGLSFSKRMQISKDIVEGIRYLHSLGLVHRDIKMKNVLLDSRDRAALSDLGFCAAEALISGSVVGTPVHMAPELLAGEYDATVDVYAFGILFWYVCAGNIKLPDAFETFQNKEQLWSKVKKGLRPERLPHFSDECWDIMTSCWATSPSRRALLGHVEDQLTAILEKAKKEDQGRVEYQPGDDCGTDDDSFHTSIDSNG